MTIEIKGQSFTLHPSGAIFWATEKTLLISDVHLGKVSHFRKYGVAVPENTIARNFMQMDLVLNHFNPQVIIFLGDLFHSKKNSEWGLFEAWAQTATATIMLVSGNHDVISKNHYEAMGIGIFTEIISGEFLLTHYPEERSGLFNFCGHIHPAVRLHGAGRQSLKLPCFFQKRNQMILPAFGAFTGTYLLAPSENDQVYAITAEEVVRVVYGT